MMFGRLVRNAKQLIEYHIGAKFWADDSPTEALRLLSFFDQQPVRQSPLGVLVTDGHDPFEQASARKHAQLVASALCCAVKPRNQAESLR